MRSIFKTLFLSLLTVGSVGIHTAVAQKQTIICNTSTGAACSISSNPGNGTQGDPAWLLSGKSNFNFDQIFNMLGPTGTLPAPLYGLQFNNNGSLGSLIPGSTGTWCFSWPSLTAAPTLVSCGSGSGTVTSVGLTVPSWLSVSPSSITTSGTFAISGTIEPNNEVLASAPSGSPTALAPRALVAADIPTISASTGLSGTLQAGQEPAHTGDVTNTAGSLATTVGKVNGLPIPPSSALVGTNASSQFVSVTTPLSLALGGTGTASPGLVSGSNISITGSWPNQTVNANIGSSAFTALTSGTNAQAAMLVGTGASLAASGSGTIAATNTTGVNGAAVPASALVLGSNSLGQLLFETTTGTGFPVLSNSPTLVTPNIGAATASSLKDSGVTGLTQCLHADSTGLISGTGADCGSGGGGTGFPALTGGTNTTAAMLVGTGASLGVSGSGTIAATSMSAAGLSGTLQAAQEPAHTADVTNTAGSLAMTVKGINGVLTSGLATGILKNTTATGVPSIAIAADFPALNQSTTGNAATASALAAIGTQCTGGQFATGVTVAGNANCATPAGGGNVSNVATPLNGQIAQWTSATTIQGLAVTGTGNAVLATSPTLVTPALGTPSSATLTNATGLPISTGVSGLGTGIATFLATPSSANLASAVTGETGTGALVLGTSPTLATPALAGSSTGTTTFASANAGASNFTLTFPAATDTVVTLAATQTLTNKSISAAQVNSGTLAAAQMPALTGDVTSTSGTVATTVGKINGTTLSGLATGLLKNTTATGVPSIATSADVIADWSGTCSATTFLRGDGSCQTPAGSGTVTTTGTPASGNLSKFSGAASVTNGDLSGDVTTAGTLAATVVKVNGAAVPTSGALLASNSSNQLTAVTLAANLAVTSGVLGTTQPINAQTGTTYTLLSTDAGKLVTLNNASAIAVTLPIATSAGFTAGYSFDVQTLGNGSATITPTTSTINGASTLVIAKNQGCTVTSDGTNYQVSACTAISGGGAAFSAITSGTNTTAAMLVGTGASLAPTGTGAISANQINATALSGLATGLLKNTTATGVPSIATSADVIADWSGTCSSSTFLRGDGSCQTPAGGGSGTVASSTTGQIPVYTAATTVTGSANATLTAGALTLGVSGTAGSLQMGNATSGTVTVQPVTGALGAVTASLPANTGTIAETNLAQTFSALQTFGTNISIGGVTATGATGTGNNVFATSPTLTTPALGTPSAAVLTNATGLPLTTGVTGNLPLTNIATIASNTVLANVTGSAAAPTAASAANVVGLLNSQSCNAQTGTTYTAVVADANNCITMNNAASNVMTIATNATQAIPVNSTLTIEQIGAGITTITPAAGVTIQSVQGGSGTISYALLGPFDYAQLKQTATNTWLLTTFGPGRGTFIASTASTFTLGTGTGACATTSTITGGATAGSFLCTGTAGAATQPIVLPAAPHGWACHASDITSGVAFAQSTTSATGCTLKGTIATTSDVVVFSAIGY